MFKAQPAISALLESYPRQRPALPEAHAKLYMHEYKVTRTAGKKMPWLSKILSRFNGWMHRQVAAGHQEGAAILEIGAGTLNHLGFEPATRAYDVIEPFEYLLQDQPNLPRVRKVYRDIRAVQGQAYDHIVSVAVLEHLAELPSTLALSGTLLKPGGTFQAGIPSEGALGWGLAWRLLSGTAYYLRNRLSKAPLMRHEHINDAPEIEALVRHFFAEVRVKRFFIPYYPLSVYTYLEAKNPRLDLCQAYLGQALAQQPEPYEKVGDKFNPALARVTYAG